MNLTEFMARQTKPVLISTGLALFAAAAYIDNATPRGFETSVFYLVPVSFFASFMGKRPGFAASLFGATVALILHRMNGASPALVYWNALAWFAVYAFFVHIISEIHDLYARERNWSRTDLVTGIPNRRSFFERLEIEKSRARRYDRPLTLAYLDLDHFKQVNDAFGHTTGDRLLTMVAQVMKHGVRREDAVARLGGDEFAVLLPDTHSVPATEAIDKLRSALNAAMTQHKWPVTFSIGVVTFQPPPESVEEIISAADRAMYCAKKSTQGGLRVERPAA